MMDPVTTLIRHDGIAVIKVTNPPVNALSQKVQRALSDQLRLVLDNQSVQGVVMAADSSNGFFSSGADVSEFASFSQGKSFDPVNSWVYQGAENSPKPIVMAVDGICFGGGLEFALCCHARVATARSTFGLPELKLGIIPGLGGTQRLPRIVGFENAITWMLRSTTVNAKTAFETGLIEEIAVGNVVDAAANQALVLRGRLPTPLLKRSDRVGSFIRCKAIASHIAPLVKRLSAGGNMPHYEECLRVSLYGVQHGGEAGLKEEARAFMKLVTSPSSLGIIHLFFAARKTSKIPLGEVMRPARSIKSVGVIGGGLMGAGIATACIFAGMRVVIKEINDKFAAAAHGRVQRNLGRKAAAISMLTVSTEYSTLSDVDIVIEAAPEIPQLKQTIFADLEKTCKPDCILATNTSTINVDLIGMGCPKAHAQGRLIGAHFFSPAHKMPLLEIVRTENTSGETVADLLAFSKRIKKTPLVVGNCAGFAVNRMYFPQCMVATFLLAIGVDAYRIDEASEKFGLPMGPFKLVDFVGMDIGIAVNGVFNMAFADRAVSFPLVGEMVKAGRKGQKTGAGFYRYSKGSRAAVKDASGIAPFVQKLRADMEASTPNYRELSAMAQKLTDDDIVDMTLLPCVNEGCRILEEGVAVRPSDLDICSVMGYAFPQYRGGIMYWAEKAHGGAIGVLRRLKGFYEVSKGFSLFRPSIALERAASIDGKLGQKVMPTLNPGKEEDIVVVSAYRTAVGRASRGGFKDTLPDDMMTPVFKEILISTGVPAEDVGDVVIGTVLQRGDTGVVETRVAGILSGLPVSVPVHTVNRLCSSGLQAIAVAAASIRAGYYDIVIAGGMETMSLASMNNTEIRPNENVKRNAMATGCYLNMGQTSENVVERFGITREDQDRLAVSSHSKAGVAKLAGRMKDEIVPIRTKFYVVDKQTKKRTGEVKEKLVDQDEGIRLGVTLDKLATLPAVFKKGGTTTPGNSSQLSDGAAAVMLMKRSEANRRGLEALASLRAFAVAGVEPAIMGIGPAVAIPKVLKMADLTIEDIDLWEINEAFASQAVYCIEKLGINRDIVNVNGGAIAIGHPLGMTGARMSVSIVHEMRRRGARYGVVSMCIGSGMGAAAIYEINNGETVSESDPYAKM